MDILPSPDNPSFETEETPFFPDEERWRGEPFLTYGARRRLYDADERNTLSTDALHGFMQTWLFFGLIAEFLGLNQLPGGEYPLDPDDAKRERDALYEDFVVAAEGGEKTITGRKALESGQLIVHRTHMAAEKETGGMPRRLQYLDQCLEIVARQIGTPTLSHRVDPRVRYSIAALGELFAQALHKAALLIKPPIAIKAPAWPWKYLYIAAGGELEEKLLRHGWCPSEIERTRTELNGLSTIHYVSRLKKFGPRRDHAGCHRYRCSAFQIRMADYQPGHVHDEKDCELVHVDGEGVLSILQDTNTYPVLEAAVQSPLSSLKQQLRVEPFTEGLAYIAISHVWADGLGNPTSNSLPLCQVNRLQRLVGELQLQLDPQWEREGRAAYRLWVDTLCCPVEIEGKKIALERIADVYRNSTHTLVLDATLSSLPSKDVQPAELLLRILGCSPWMRRLWTFQEGTLPKSLFFQFEDRAVSPYELLEQVHGAANQDIRYRRLWTDCWVILDTFARFSSTNRWQMTYSKYDKLLKLQWALNSRSVSVPKDEPLCIATILGLDLTRVISENSAQQRMAAVWEMVAEMLNGIPPNVIFFIDKPLEVEGFRWAPRTLLAGDVEGDQDVDASNPYAERKFVESAFDLNHRHTRFVCSADTKMSQLAQTKDAKGLRGQYAGFRIQVTPYKEFGGSALGKEEWLHPWTGTLPWVAEDALFLREEETGRWYQICDHYYSQMISRWTEEETHEWQLSVGQRLCDYMHTGRCAVIWNIKENAYSQEMGMGLLVLVESEPNGDSELLLVRRRLNVLVARVTEAETVVLDTMSELAAQLACEDVTAAFVAGRSAGAKKRLIERMKQLVAQAWDSRPEFAAAAAKTMQFGDDVRAQGWALFAKICSHRTFLVRTPVDQLWLID